jgi:hypothetical protein
MLYFICRDIFITNNPLTNKNNLIGIFDPFDCVACIVLVL